MGLKVELKNFWNAALPATEGTLYTCPTGKKVLIKSIHLQETSGADRVVRIYSVQGSTKVPLVRVTLTADYALDEDKPIVLEAGESISGLGTVANAVMCKISGVEETE